MVDQPFHIFDSFKDRLDVRFMTREDQISSDVDVEKILGTDQFVSLKQVHGNRIVVADKPIRRTEEADGCITSRPSLWLTIRAADCQQLIIYAPEKNIIGVIHAGWKGLKAGTIQEFFSVLQYEHGVEASEAYVGIGPSLCEKCAEFTDPATELAGLDSRFFHDRHADLRGIADEQLDHIGVPRNQRERNPDCTKCMNETYWSYRGGDREKVGKGWCNVFAVSVHSD